jgi:hypothetical protein
VTEDRYEAGTVIVRQGSRGETMFVIVEGRAKVVRDERTIAHRPRRRVLRRDLGDRRPSSDGSGDRGDADPLPSDLPGPAREALMDGPAAAWAMLESLASQLREE